MSYARATDGCRLHYEAHGNKNAAPVLLIQGLGADKHGWNMQRFALALHYRVIALDNRGAGRSDKPFGHYSLEQMADDAIAVLDDAGVERAHIVGASMGGMIVQAIAIRHPHRVISMTSIMSTTGNPNVGQATPAAMTALMAPPATSRDEAIERGKQSARIVGSPGYPAGDEVVAARIARDFDRCFYPIGVARQMLAVMATGDRSEALNTVTAPTLVIHGEDDPLVTLSGGQATAAAIPGARLVTFPGMGHDLPASLRAKFVEVIAGHAASVPG